ncbi:MAG: MdtA/MuxA family multidrug efflux RND transporter periplasmic adaptor subunit [Candidatus Binataceae bacterium]|jgi:multidrug efflux system membrane fusion protein
MNSDVSTIGQPRDIPPIRRAGIAKRWAWLAIFLVLIVVGYFFLTRPSGARTTPVEASSPAHGAVVPVSAAPAKLGDLNRYVTAIGTVTAFNTVTVKTRVDGQLIKVAFTEGQIVHEGDLLAEIDPRPYQVQLAQAEGQLARDRASQINAKVTLERDRSLYADNVIARQDLDNQESAAGQYDGAIITDNANIDSAKLQLTYCRITSPLTGRIGLRLVDQGNMVHATDTQGLAVITQLQPIAVLFSIPEDDLPELTTAMKSDNKLPVEAWDRDFKTRLASGALLTLDNQIDQSTGTIRLKAVFPNEDNSLFPNQFVNAKLLVGTMRGVVLVPTAAVQRSSQGTFTYVVQEDQSVQIRNVTVSATQGDLAAIASGLKTGELVVTDGVDKLRQGARVSVQLAANPVVPGATQ